MVVEPTSEVWQRIYEWTKTVSGEGRLTDVVSYRRQINDCVKFIFDFQPPDLDRPICVSFDVYDEGIVDFKPFDLMEVYNDHELVAQLVNNKMELFRVDDPIIVFGYDMATGLDYPPTVRVFFKMTLCKVASLVVIQMVFHLDDDGVEQLGRYLWELIQPPTRNEK